MEEARKYDYADSHSVKVKISRPISAQELSEQFFHAPKWIRGLMNLRNTLMKPFGVKNEHDLSDLVSTKSFNTAFIKKNAKHLDLKIEFETKAIDTDNQEISVNTRVNFNNRFGKCYFTCIRPFHNIICKTLLKRAKSYFEK